MSTATASTTEPERALLYCRVSKDAKGRGRSVSEQEADGRKECASRSWRLDDEDVIVDNHRSASRYAKGTRDGWADVGRRLASGRYDVLVTWEASRSTRRLEGFVELRDLCERHGVKLCYSGDVLDMTKRSDRKRAAMDAIDAEDESERTRERILRTTGAQAARGMPHGRRLYGYDRKYDPDTGALVNNIPNPAEAEVVREMARRFLAGETSYAIADDLNDRGLTTLTGKPWSLERVRQVLTNPHYAGFRKHRGQIVGDATWEPLIERDDFARIMAKFTDPARTSNRDRRDIRWLLTGIARCGKCGAAMYRGHDRKQRPTYVCRKGKGHLTRDLRAVDAYVTDVVVSILCDPDVVAALHASAEPDPVSLAALDHAATLRARLDEAAAAFTKGTLSLAMLSRVEGELLPQIADAERQARSVSLPAILLDAIDEGPDGWWKRATIEQRREVVRWLVDITILPSVSGRRLGLDSYETAVRIDLRLR